MPKELSQMTVEELWKLFPICLTAYKDEWAAWYDEEEKRIAGFLHMGDVRIHHIGSTAVHAIWAKPIVDILLEIPNASSMEKVKAMLIKNGYICMSESACRKSFNKGYTNEGFADRVFHLHLRFYGDNDELYFRDYLNDDPAVAKEYEALKLSLWRKFEHNRDAYTDAKTDFIKEYTAKAKKKYKNRYANVEKTGICERKMITIKRLILSAATDEEMEQMLASESDEEMKAAYAEMLNGCRKYPEARIWYALWLMKLADAPDEAIGSLCFKGISSDGIVEIGYGIKPAYEGQGYTSEAVNALAHWAMMQPGVKRVEAETDPGNIPSQKVLRNAGFVPAGETGEEGPRFALTSSL